VPDFLAGLLCHGIEMSDRDGIGCCFVVYFHQVNKAEYVSCFLSAVLFAFMTNFSFYGGV
jgi:hypothetical protein